MSSSPLPHVDPAKDLLHVIGQSIEDDVDTYDIDEDARTMLVTRDGRDYRLVLEEVPR